MANEQPNGHAKLRRARRRAEADAVQVKGASPWCAAEHLVRRTPPPNSLAESSVAMQVDAAATPTFNWPSSADSHWCGLPIEWKVRRPPLEPATPAPEASKFSSASRYSNG